VGALRGGEAVLDARLSHVPDDPGPYRPPAWLPGGHAQTIWPALLRRPDVPLRRERVATPDGDVWSFDWIDAPARAGAPVVVLFHGLEGNSSSHYARALLHAARLEGFRAVVPHFRGCAGEPNGKPRAYHMGDHEEVGAMLAAVRERIGPDATVHAAGVSLGGSALLNWLGRAGRGASSFVSRAAAVSSPAHIPPAGHSLDRGANRLYARLFLRTLNPKARTIARRFPDRIDAARTRRFTRMRDFDDAVTAPLHGFADALDYWTRASSRPWLAGIAVPTLILNACNDPFVPRDALAREADVSASVTLERTAGGGHAGFLSGAPPGCLDWLPRRLLHWFSANR